MSKIKHVLQLGVAKVDITPTAPVPLAGFSHRSGVFDSVVRPLYARLFLFEQMEQRYLLVSADLIWWGPAMVHALQQSVYREFRIPPSQLLLHATHNHSGPQTSDDFTPSLGKCNAEYAEWLQMQIHEGIQQAFCNLESVTVEMGVGNWSEGINRRRIVNGVCEMAPNLDGSNDQTVSVVRFCRNDRRVKAILLHATCHPTTTGDNRVSSEFPGYAMEHIEQYYQGDGTIAGFLQGFCGDVRPALIRDEQFFRGHDEDVQRIGMALAMEALRVLRTDMLPLQIEALASKVFTVNLQLSRLPKTAELHSHLSGDGVLSEWAGCLLERQERLRTAVPLEMTYFRIANGLTLLTANAEMVVEYGHFAKRVKAEIQLPVGYTNGMVGYVPTAKQIAEGGYEACDSAYYFVLPAPFSSAIEADIQDVIAKLGKKV